MSDTGSEVIKVTATPVIPEELHGFTVTVGLGPYPPGDPKPGQHAVYAELVPMTQQALDAMHYIGKSRILGWVPLTPEGAAEIAADPQGAQAEHAATLALRAAAQHAKRTEAP